ncbi:hypothetical protein BKA70DRAFT_1570687 [Coprinopsis sp. MPI-PUGE-AT-0042]|nr:hypothetical protein BKA70DRAFT_1570687 [Coprinopsis sp. MPI-PUGE-AT-0042]
MCSHPKHRGKGSDTGISPTLWNAEWLGKVKASPMTPTRTRRSFDTSPKSPPTPLQLEHQLVPWRGNPDVHHVELSTTEEPSRSSIGISPMPELNNETGFTPRPGSREDGKPYVTFRSGFEDYSPAKGVLYSKVNESKAAIPSTRIAWP